MSGSDAGWWRLPLDLSRLENEDEYDTLLPPKQCAGADWWRLPLDLDRLLKEEEEDHKRCFCRAAELQLEDAELPKDCSISALLESDDLDGDAALPPALEKVSEVACKPLVRTSFLESLGDVVSRANKALEGAGWMEDVQRRLVELNEDVARFNKGVDGSGGSDSAGKEELVRNLPTELYFHRVVEMLPLPHGLDAAACICVEWSRHVKAKWRVLCATDWGVKRGGSRKVYQQWLKRWQILQASLAALDSTPHRSGFATGLVGTVARRRLFEALEFLVELGASLDCEAKYPAQVVTVFQTPGVIDALLMLLDDESPYLTLLAVRCLADAAAFEPLRSSLRYSIISCGQRVRKLLENDDEGMIEAAARLMLNCHGNAPGVPLSGRHRGPCAWMTSKNQELESGQPPKALKGSPKGSRALATRGESPQALATAWSGVWKGEMRYARGGERHAILELVLGVSGDPVLVRALAAQRKELSVKRTRTGHSGLQCVEGYSADTQQQAGTEATGMEETPMMQAEGRAEYFRRFGFLAASDFDGRTDTIDYMNEQLKLPKSPTACAPLGGKAAEARPLLVGEGWDEQNGFFAVEAEIPIDLIGVGSRQRVPSLAPAVPVRLGLRYKTRGSLYEFVAFLAEASPDAAISSVDDVEGSSSHSPRAALYGVWSINPTFHRHLFVLQRVGRLEDKL